MKPWFVNPSRVLIAARKLARAWEADKQTWTREERRFYEAVIGYEGRLCRGGPKKKSKKAA